MDSMSRSPKVPALRLARRLTMLACLLCLAGAIAARAPDRASGAALQTLSVQARQQIGLLIAEKQGRTPAQRKIDSNLLWKIQQLRRDPIATTAVPSLRADAPLDAGGRATVDITADVTAVLLEQIRALGGTIEAAFPQYHSIRAQISPLQAEPIAALDRVRFIQPAQRALGASTLTPAWRPWQAPRPAALNTSEGDVTHRADLARATFGFGGAGIKVGVLSDGVNALRKLQTSGDLPAVTVLPGQAGSGNEGSAMLELVHDLAPDAQLYFATATGGVAAFASNILALRAAGCDIIIDDVTYFSESPFHAGQPPGLISPSNGALVAQAVSDVTAAGTLYFAAATNSGNLDAGQSGVWEGDFADGGPVGGATAARGGQGTLHDFDPSAAVSTYDSVTAAGGFNASLFWANPLGAATDDYDLYVLDASGTSVIAASTNEQSGTQDPIEIAGGSIPAGARIAVVRYAGQPRFLHLTTNRGRLAFGTAGAIRGHAAAVAPYAFGVAAAPAAGAYGEIAGSPAGPYPGVFTSANQIERFSSDGPRHYFYAPDGSAITPGDLLASGGQIIPKPDLAAADGVSAAAPGFSPFFGTSAAAAHTGAIAALVKSVNPAFSQAQIRTFLIGSAIDIQDAGADRDSGAGLLDAFLAVQRASAAVPASTPTATATATPTATPTTTPPPTTPIAPTSTPANVPSWQFYIPLARS